MKQILETERTYLREFSPDDAKAVLALSGNPQVTRYTGDADMVKTLEDAEGVIRTIWLREYKEYGHGRWAVVDKSSSVVIGFCGFKYIPQVQMPDIGYRFLPEYWGKGLASETALACIHFADVNLHIPKYFADVMPDNHASVRVIEKLGMKFSKNIEEDGETFRRFTNF